MREIPQEEWAGFIGSFNLEVGGVDQREEAEMAEPRFPAQAHQGTSSLRPCHLTPCKPNPYGSWNIANSKTLKCLMSERRRESWGPWKR